MRNAARKHLRYYVVNPASDRRIERRFESREDVALRFTDSGRIRTGIASDIGRMGLRLEADGGLKTGEAIEVAFPKSADGIRCFGRVVWTRRIAGSRREEVGVAIEAWYGIVMGGNSWLRFKNGRMKKDRRSSPR